MRKEIGDIKGEAANYVNLGILLYSRGEFKKLKNTRGKLSK